VTKNIRKYIDECDLCQRMKNRTEAPVGKLIANKILERLYMHLTVDFITKLPLIAGMDAIFVVCNRLSKITHFVTTTERKLAERLARSFRNNM